MKLDPARTLRLVYVTGSGGTRRGARPDIQGGDDDDTSLLSGARSGVVPGVAGPSLEKSLIGRVTTPVAGSAPPSTADRGLGRDSVQELQAMSSSFN